MITLDTIPSDIRGLIFDCDGTLVDTAPVYTRAWVNGFRAAGGAITPAWYLARNGMSESVLMDQFEHEFKIPLDREEIVATMRADFLCQLDELKEIAAIASIARQNGGRRPMAVASGGSRAIVTATLDAVGLTSLFDAIITIDDVGRAKPEPHLFLAAAERLAVPPEHCLVFEDSREGLEAATRAKMRTVDVRRVSASTG